MKNTKYKQTDIGIIPEDWECVMIDDILQEITMGPFGSDITVSNFVSSGCISNCRIRHCEFP